MRSLSSIEPPRRAVRAATLGAALAASFAAAAPRAMRAQAAPVAARATARDTPRDTARDTVPSAPVAVAECFGFAFGPWRPPLDWRAAGRGGDAPSVRLPGEFAARDSAAGGYELLLFPSWWPAGVGVRFDRAPRVPGDTAAGVAHAFVADGRRATPSTTVRAWLKPCGGEARPR